MPWSEIPGPNSCRSAYRRPRRLPSAAPRRTPEWTCPLTYWAAPVNEELRQTDTRAEIYLVGGAVMCLAYGARPSAKDVDALFRPAGVVRQAAARVAVRANADARWLNDAVKDYLSERADFAPFSRWITCKS